MPSIMDFTEPSSIIEMLRMMKMFDENANPATADERDRYDKITEKVKTHYLKKSAAGVSEEKGLDELNKMMDTKADLGNKRAAADRAQKADLNDATLLDSLQDITTELNTFTDLYEYARKFYKDTVAIFKAAASPAASKTPKAAAASASAKVAGKVADHDVITKATFDKKYNILKQGLSIDEIYDALANLSVIEGNIIDMTGFEGMGIMDSHAYRVRFMGLITDIGINKMELFNIVAMTVAIKNRERIIMWIESDEQRAKTFKKELEFFKTKCCQYVTGAKNSLFPLVKIPETVPTIAANGKIAIIINSNFDDISIVKTFLENLWAPMFYLTDDLLAIQRTWEVDYWNNTVKKTKNTLRQKDLAFTFHEEFWSNKANDCYPLIAVDGTVLSESAKNCFTAKAHGKKPLDEKALHKALKYMKKALLANKGSFI